MANENIKKLLPARVPYDRYGKGFNDCLDQVSDLFDEHDIVEVVRCKDCRWYQEGEIFAPNKFCFRLEHPTEDRKIGYNYAPDDFCSYGKRR